MLFELDLPRDLRKLTYKELEKLATEIRKYIITVCFQNGGHLAPSLGVIELTMALLRNFDFLRDRIVWDVGHQSYPYKILTDRRDKFVTLRQYNGISGFIAPWESPYDHFAVGHSSTSISAGLGINVARHNTDTWTVVVIGDGSLTAGIAYEGLCNAPQYGKNFLIILNDNGMSIDRNVGALSSYLQKIKVSLKLKNLKGAARVFDKLFKFEETLEEYLFTGGSFFTSLGFEYIGPVDGHDIKLLDEVLKSIRTIKRPVVLHVLTQKGKGWFEAEEDPEKFHGISGPKVKKSENFSSVFGRKLTELAKENNNIYAITAAMPLGTGLKEFQAKFADRFFDVGICEQHAVTFAAGLAKEGKRPVVAIYSTFLQRGYDQIIHDVALQNLPVVFAIDRAGLVGEDGPTHHGVFDIGYLRIVPNMVLTSAPTREHLEALLEWAVNYKEGPVAIRYPRAKASSLEELGIEESVSVEKGVWEYYSSSNDENLENYVPKLDRLEKVRTSKADVVVILEGFFFSRLFKRFIENGWDVVNPVFLKPMDEELLETIVRSGKKLVVVEWHSQTGGLFSAVAEWAAKRGVGLKALSIGIPEEFVPHGKIEDLLKHCNLDTDSIEERIRKWCVE